MAISFLFQIIGALIALLTIRIYSEVLSPDQLGEAMLALGIVSLFDAIISSSISQVVFYYGSKDKAKYQVFSQAIQYKAIAIRIGGGGIVLLMILNTISHNIFTFWISTLLLIVTYCIVEPSKSSLFSLLNLTSNRKVYGLQVVIDSSLTLIMTYYFLLMKPYWVSLLIGIVAARYISIFTNSYLLKLGINEIQEYSKYEIEYSKEDVIKHIRPIMLMGVLGWIGSFADRYIIGGALSVRDIGYYSITTGLVNRPYSITTSAFTAYFRPPLFTSFSKRKIHEFKRIQLLWFLSTICVGIGGALLFYLLGSYAVKFLLSVKYQGQVESLLWLIAIAMTLNITTHVFDNKFLAQGLGQNLFRLQIALLPVPLILIFTGAFYGGIMGAVLGKLIAELIKLISTFTYSQKKIV